MTSTIIALEGASGAGKTTICTELLKRNPSWIGVHPMNFSRERNIQTEVVGNSASDYVALATAMSYPNATIISDRGFLGHWVYEAYKQGIRENWITPFLTSIYNLEDIFHFEIASRWLNLPHIVERPNIHILVIDPTYEQLMKQRKSSGKEYPYNELSLYRKMALEIYGIQNDIHLKVSLINWPIHVESLETIITPISNQ